MHRLPDKYKTVVVPADCRQTNRKTHWQIDRKKHIQIYRSADRQQAERQTGRITDK